MSRRRSLAAATISTVPLTTVLLCTLILLLAAPPVSAAQVQLGPATASPTLPAELILQPEHDSKDGGWATVEAPVPRGEEEVEALTFAEDLAALQKGEACWAESFGSHNVLGETCDDSEAAAPLSILTLHFLDDEHAEQTSTVRAHEKVLSPSSVPSSSAVVPAARSATALPVFVPPSSDPATSGVISLLCKTVSYTLALTVLAVFVFLYSGPGL
ncbi:uncharacterized protein JCM10292_000312 [Rhodotorula paludigena]|uniref:uncharacterized protein n=1 Tax=Rhodotorula paludigena TaxID=86838 RepID=UPI0031774356